MRAFERAPVEEYTQDLLRYTRQAGRGMQARITILGYQQKSAVSIALEQQSLPENDRRLQHRDKRE